MKSPPVQHPDAVALELTEAFIRGEGGSVVLEPDIEPEVAGLKPA
jgi:hypothetical protein